MFTISNSQMQRFASDAHMRFVEKMKAFLRREYAEKVQKLDDSQVETSIQVLIKLAGNYHLKKEMEIQYFISLNYFLNWNGTINDPGIEKAFIDPALSPKEKFEITKNILKQKYSNQE